MLRSSSTRAIVAAMRTLRNEPPLLRACGLLCKGAAALLLCSAAPVDEVATLLTGDFDNVAQYDAADAALKVPPSVGGTWLDRQHATLRAVDAPLLGGRAIYLEWHGGSATGPISRQRLWVFRTRGGAPVMDFYTLRDPAALAGKGDLPGSFAALTPADLKGYGDACAAVFTRRDSGWRGIIDPARCRIVAASGRGMRIAATVGVDAKGFDYRESGRLDDGEFAFQVPPTTPYRFVRRR